MSDYTTIEDRVEKNLSRQKWIYRILFFVMHGLFFVVSMLAVWGTVLSNAQLRALLFDSGAGTIVILPTILWAAVILFHAASLYFESSAGEKAMRKQLLVREISEDMLREKPKRQSEASGMRLSDDGELIPADEDDYVDNTRANHAGAS